MPMTRTTVWRIEGWFCLQCDRYEKYCSCDLEWEMKMQLTDDQRKIYTKLSLKIRNEIAAFENLKPTTANCLLLTNRIRRHMEILKEKADIGDYQITCDETNNSTEQERINLEVSWNFLAALKPVCLRAGEAEYIKGMTDFLEGIEPVK